MVQLTVPARLGKGPDGMTVVTAALIAASSSAGAGESRGSVVELALECVGAGEHANVSASIEPTRKEPRQDRMPMELGTVPAKKSSEVPDHAMIKRRD